MRWTLTTSVKRDLLPVSGTLLGREHRQDFGTTRPRVMVLARYLASNFHCLLIPSIHSFVESNEQYATRLIAQTLRRLWSTIVRLAC